MPAQSPELSQGSRYARGKRHIDAGAELEPLSRRLLQAAGVLSLTDGVATRLVSGTQLT